MKKIILGSRGSKLALIQTQIIAALLKKTRRISTEIKIIKTEGDLNQSTDACLKGGKGGFVKKIEDCLLDSEIDIAVHSLKDMPALLHNDLCIGAYAGGEDKRDVLVSRDNFALSDLPAGSKIGTGSPRRSAQIRALRNDLEIAPIRGNVETRIQKMNDGKYDAVILAAAGLKRLGLENRITEYLPADLFIPSPGQGIIAVETKKSDKETILMLKEIDNGHLRFKSEIEFGILHRLKATCSTPVGINCRIHNNIEIDFFLSDEECSRSIKDTITAYGTGASDIADFAAEKIKELWNFSL